MQRMEPSLEVLQTKDPNPRLPSICPNNVMFSSMGSELFQGTQNGIRVGS